MSKPQYIQELLAGLNTNLNKSELGVYILGQSSLPVGCTAWRRAEMGDYSQVTNSYFDLLTMILEAANLGEPWAKQLIADFLVRVRT